MQAQEVPPSATQPKEKKCIREEEISAGGAKIIISTDLEDEDRDTEALLPSIQEAVKSAACPQDLMRLPTRFSRRIASATNLGADMSSISQLLGKLANHGEEWEARRQRAVPRVPINQINDTAAELERIKE